LFVLVFSFLFFFSPVRFAVIVKAAMLLGAGAVWFLARITLEAGKCMLVCGGGGHFVSFLCCSS
jgi:hypothetical protein